LSTNTYVALDKVTVGTATATVTFSSIPQGYTDLVLVATPIFSTAANVNIRINGDTGSNYSDTYLTGNGTTAGSARDSNQSLIYFSGTSVGVTTANRDNGIAHFMNYSNTTTNKSVLLRYNQPGQIVVAMAALWRNTAAITSISLIASTGNLDVGSTFSLYGIAASSVGAKATGGIITSDSQYYYHTFLSSGTFTPTQSLSCDYLVVAGGGGGGVYAGGGGGGGGYLTGSSFSVSATPYSITVGSGGAGGSGFSNPGTIGNNSIFSSITSTGGGRGGAQSTIGGDGGSGGGAPGLGTYAGGAASPSGQGSAGGSTSSGTAGGSGGGGASAVGTSGSSSGANNIGGAGGSGSASSITGTSITRSGGGGGAGGGAGPVGAGGSGGGGAGGLESGANGTSGTVNTGGGGGGAWLNATAGSGGSGIVIVRYAK
jgi:hypothetical protein